MLSIRGKLIDIAAQSIRPVELQIHGGRIAGMEDLPDDDGCENYLLPGFIDAHVHVESSMLTPAQFARVAVTHGTVGSVSDPHEIANVLGVEGVRYMLENAKTVPFKFCFGAPSCVPATAFETSGSAIDVEQTRDLLKRDDIGYLAEMMNFPGVLGRDSEVMAKIQAAAKLGKPTDGHAPGLRGEDAIRYFAAGITTDHECSTEAEAVDKLEAGVIIQIREGSAARNFEALVPLIDRYPGRIMFCSDDKHPDELLAGHINQLCRRAIEAGCDLFHVLRAACMTPVEHYRMDVGQLRIGDAADFIEIDSPWSFGVVRTFLNGECVAQRGESRIGVSPTATINRFSCSPKSIDEFEIPAEKDTLVRVMVAHDQLLTTTSEILTPEIRHDQIVSDTDQDVLKITVVNRYADAVPAMALVRGFGFNRGAIAGSVGHDCHNIVAVGVSDEDLCDAVNEVIRCRGGLSVADQGRVESLPLPIAGLISALTCEEVAEHYLRLDGMAKSFGCTLQAPFMTLSFMALLVIPSLKLSDRGLFDGERFEFVDLCVSQDEAGRRKSSGLSTGGRS